MAFFKLDTNVNVLKHDIFYNYYETDIKFNDIRVLSNKKIGSVYPDLFKKKEIEGTEIIDKDTFYKDVEKSIKTLEDCTGKKVTSFRAPGFSITNKNKWAFETLYELGIKKDSSVFPARRAHGGLRSYKIATPSIIKYNGIKVLIFIDLIKFFRLNRS